ncbi:hypothetical protein C8J56DRAFT_1056326 [Mycena floridula]|nr:hypothetical protein C8J56DRAFT_1056326 [Mycena floridula]
MLLSTIVSYGVFLATFASAFPISPMSQSGSLVARAGSQEVSLKTRATKRKGHSIARPSNPKCGKCSQRFESQEALNLHLSGGCNVEYTGSNSNGQPFPIPKRGAKDEDAKEKLRAQFGVGKGKKYQVRHVVQELVYSEGGRHRKVSDMDDDDVQVMSADMSGEFDDYGTRRILLEDRLSPPSIFTVQPSTSFKSPAPDTAFHSAPSVLNGILRSPGPAPSLGASNDATVTLSGFSVVISPRRPGPFTSSSKAS